MKRWLINFVGLLCALAPAVAAAHPMGNFSINHYAALLPGDGVPPAVPVDPLATAAIARLGAAWPGLGID